MAVVTVLVLVQNHASTENRGLSAKKIRVFLEIRGSSRFYVSNTQQGDYRLLNIGNTGYEVGCPHIPDPQILPQGDVPICNLPLDRVVSVIRSSLI